MGETTGIAWTSSTFNPWIGCTKVSAGCTNCYAEADDKRHGGRVNQDGVRRLSWGKGAERTPTTPEYWRGPVRWDRKAQKLGVRPRVFCASQADVFDPEVPDAWRLELFDLIRRTPYLDWLLLTKRPGLIGELRQRAAESFRRTWWRSNVPKETVDWLSDWSSGRPPKNVWLGTTVENQEQAELRVPALLEQPAVVRFLSCEPLLEAVSLLRWLAPHGAMLRGPSSLPSIHWVIIGGESGPKARPFALPWARMLQRACDAAGVAVFMKQMGDHAVSSDGVRLTFQGHHGADPSEWPPDLRVQSFPEVAR